MVHNDIHRILVLFRSRVKAVTAGVYAAVFAAATAYHLYLTRAAWVRDEGCADLWDWKEAILYPDVWLATANDMLVLALLTAMVFFRRHVRPWAAWLCGLWGITWVLVALACTGDLTRSSAGPMNIPMFVFALPLACLLCLLEGLVLLLIRAVDRNTPRARRNRVMWVNGEKERVN